MALLPGIGGGNSGGIEQGSGTSGLGGLTGGVTLPSSDMQMMNLQQRMMKENEIYQMLSNIMKMRHDGHMNAIGNIK